MANQTLLSGIVLFFCVSPVSGFGQAPPPSQANTVEQQAKEAMAAGLAMMAAGDPGTAMEVLRPTASRASDPALAQGAQCLMGGAMAMTAQIRPMEAAVGILNNPSTPTAQTAWKRVLPECVRQLEGIAGRIPPDKRASLFYFLGLVGTDEPEHIRYLREAVKARPDFQEASFQLGIHLLGYGELQEAETIFRRIAEVRPEWAEPRSNLGMVLMLSGRPQEAVPQFREALKIRPEFVEAQGQLGLALYASGDYDGALTECGLALRQQATNPFHYNCAALALLEKNQPADALAYARRASELAPTHETFQLVLAAALAAGGQKEQALETMRRAVAAQPRLLTDPSRLEKGNMLRGRALALARDLLKKASAK